MSGRLCALLLAAAIAVQTGRAAADDRNKCGCYRDQMGSCLCDKKARCGCPGDCEPRGCEEQRDRELQKQIDAETKRASEGERHRPSAKDDEAEAEPERLSARPPAPPRAPARKLSRAQGKELARLLELYLADHPDARSKKLVEVQGELAGER
jgi:hypothetical protein